MTKSGGRSLHLSAPPSLSLRGGVSRPRRSESRLTCERDVSDVSQQLPAGRHWTDGGAEPDRAAPGGQHVVQRVSQSVHRVHCPAGREGQGGAGQVRSGQVWSGQVRSGQVRSGQVRSGQVRSGLVWSGLERARQSSVSQAE